MAKTKEIYPRKICIQGTWYTIEERSATKDPELQQGCGGYFDPYNRRCVVKDFSKDKDWDPDEARLMQSRIIRHEIIHAFLYESGLDECSWAQNEEIVDFFALNLPKLFVCCYVAEVLEWHRPGKPDEQTVGTGV